MLAADVIILLTKAFKKSTGEYIGHPLKRHIESAAVEYCAISKVVHDKIGKKIEDDVRGHRSACEVWILAMTRETLKTVSQNWKLSRPTKWLDSHLNKK
jgi:hypothetical protein